MRRGAAAGILAAAVVLATSAHAQLPGPGVLTETGCDDPTKPNADYEAYGPTDVNVQAGNGPVTVGENSAGTITVFKYPNPSYYNQVKYLALSRDDHARVQAQFPNEGSFAGIGWRTRAGKSGFAWLRDWAAEQDYDSADTPVPVTTYRAPGGLGLTVTSTDVAVPGGAFVRELWVKRAPASTVSSASLVYYENFNPVGTRIPYLPIADWCLSQQSDQHAAYDRGAHAIVHSWSGTDQATGRPSSVAFAFGFDDPDAAHQVGTDGYDPAASPGGPADGYGQGAAPAGSDSADGQVTGSLAEPLRFDRRGRAAARVTIAPGADPAGAVATLQRARRQSFPGQMAAVERDWRNWLARTKIPATGDARVTAVAKRSLISVRLAMVPETGAIVASSDTQGPYGEDWIRDGAFINQLLDDNGLADDVTRHNLFYARVQTSTGNPSALRPPGNWPMASYGDGVDGAPIPWEIDETGLGIWTLWSHAAYLSGQARSDYLARVYPAIGRAADFLAQCQDPVSGLQCAAAEDDNYTPSQSLHGAETVWLGLKSAIEAAGATGDSSARVGAWRARFARLDHAIAGLYDPSKGSYQAGNANVNAYNVDYGDGGWLLWPVRFRPYEDPTMRAEADAVRRALDASLAAPRGQYEGKALVGLAHAWAQPSGAQSAELRRTAAYMARALTTRTGLFGESWIRFAGGQPGPVQDMPHVWAHTLFYLGAVGAYGARPYSFERTDLWRAACAAGAAPPSACPAPARHTRHNRRHRRRHGM